MNHARPDSTASAARQRQAGRKLGLVFALLVMCLAVLPHVTLAASMMMGRAMPGQANAPAHDTVADMSGAATPCHEDAGTAATHQAPAPCCVVGCGLIAEAPEAPLLPAVLAWSRARPPSASPVGGLSPEPAEHPPRSGVRTT